MNKVVLEQIGDVMQMTLPADTVRRLGLKPGQEVDLLEKTDGLHVVIANPALDRQRALAYEVLHEQAETLKALASR